MSARFAAAVGIGVIVLLSGTGCGTMSPLPEIRVMSFNIRNGMADDGDNSWEQRRTLVIETIRDGDPDIVGVQEAFAFQVDELRAALPQYELVGAGRTDGARRGEFVPILFRDKMFVLEQAGHLWLSETPDKPGSVGWDAELPRMATWVMLSFRDSPVERLFVVNTHLSHRGARSRIEAARLIRKLVADEAGAHPALVLGDFNTGPDTEPHRALLSERGTGPALEDPFVTLDPQVDDPGTYHAFSGKPAGDRIDWILHAASFEPVAVGLERRSFDGRYPSDHFPVTATLRLAR